MSGMTYEPEKRVGPRTNYPGSVASPRGCSMSLGYYRYGGQLGAVLGDACVGSSKILYYLAGHALLSSSNKPAQWTMSSELTILMRWWRFKFEPTYTQAALLSRVLFVICDARSNYDCPIGIGESKPIIDQENVLHQVGYIHIGAAIFFEHKELEKVKPTIHQGKCGVQFPWDGPSHNRATPTCQILLQPSKTSS